MSLNYPYIYIDRHLTGKELVKFIREFDRMNSFVPGSIYIINGKEVRV